MSNRNDNQLRQGDVCLERLDRGELLPKGAKKLGRTRKGLVLQEGEVTGHAHRIRSRSAALYSTEEGERFLRVMGPAPVKLEHEEHLTVSVPAGVYRITIPAEYAPGELPRQVQD